MAWTTPTTSPADRARILGPGGGDRVHVVEYRWLAAMQTVPLYAYRLPADRFAPFGEPVPHAMVATEPIEPLGPPQRVPDLFKLHEAAGIQLRVLPNLWAFWDAVVRSTLDHSGIRLRNAAPAHRTRRAGGALVAESSRRCYKPGTGETGTAARAAGSGTRQDHACHRMAAVQPISRALKNT
jgi:hypothetical protein